MNLNDVASVVEDVHRQESLFLATRSVNSPKPIGKCLWCGESIAEDATNQRFCDSDHRDEYDRFLVRHPELQRKR